MKRLAFLAAFLASACATHSSVSDLGGGRFLTSSHGQSGFASLDDQRAGAISEARAYCVARGKELEVIDVRDTPGPYILGRYPKSDVTFRCV